MSTAPASALSPSIQQATANPWFVRLVVAGALVLGVTLAAAVADDGSANAGTHASLGSPTSSQGSATRAAN
jgi:hypothetical protein